MDYVYICRSGDNEELRYSIRSIEENMPKGKIWIIGYKPGWYVGNFVSVKDSGNKFDNIKKCLAKTADVPEISDKFVLMNDDFFVVSKMSSVPILHGGSLKDKVSEYKRLVPSSYYTKLLENTHKRLVRLGIENPIDYDIHTPLIVDKTKIKEITDMPYLDRSTYGNVLAIGGQEFKDVKVYSSGRMDSRSYDFSTESLFISTEDTSFHKILPMLQNLFPNPSSYESTARGI